MLEHIVENSKKSLTELFHPSTLFEWLFLLIMIGCFCFTIALLYAWIHETIHEKKKKSKYPSLLKKYYRQYGDYVFETEEFVEEINLLYDNKAPQEIRFDLKDASAKVGDSKNKCKKGVWLVVVKNDMKIHPLNKEVIISHIRINGNTISFLERVKDRYRTYSSYREQRIQANRWTYSVDISRYQVSDSADDDIWKDCLRYNVGKNTMLKILVKAMTDCYNISSCFLTDDKAKYACKQCMNQLNPLLQPYHMRTEMTQESWQFYYNDAPITLEEVIKKLPDDVLSKELNKSDPKSPKAFNQDTPSIAQSQSIFQEKLPYISEDEYIAQLEELYRKFGNNAFHYIMSVQNRTGYSKEKIKTDLKNIRSKVDAMSPPKYSQSKSSQYYPRVVQKPLPEEEYITKLENLYRKFGDNAFQHLSEIQKQTGFNRKKVEIDLSEVRHRLWLNAELSKEQPQSKPRQPSLRTAQEVSTPPQSQPRTSTPAPAQKAPAPPPKAPSKPTKAPKPSQSQPKPSTPAPTQKAPTVPQSESKQSTSSAQQKIAKPITNFPFDLRYLPDLTFYSQEKAATVFPDIVGSGTLLISPSLSCNFAKIGLIIDNYLIQFDASGYMHILDIVKNEYQTLNLSTIDKSDNAFKDWVMQISSGAPALNRIISNDQRAYKYLIAFTQLVYHHTYQGLEQEKYNMFLGAVQAAFGIPRNGNTLEIRNRVWYYNGEKQTWGQVAHSLFRDEKSQVFDLHSL